MNEPARQGDKRMTVREVAEVLGVSTDTIKNCIRDLFPDLMRNGRTTYLNEAQVTTVKMNLRKIHRLPPCQKRTLEKS
jgi:excisionase family DNA binding protein